LINVRVKGKKGVNREKEGEERIVVDDESD